MADIEVTGWGKKGPGYKIHGFVLDRKTHRRVPGVLDSESSDGKPKKGGQHAVVRHRNQSWLILRRGYSYDVKLELRGGTVTDITIDASDEHKVVELDPFARVSGVKAVSQNDEE